MDWIGDALTITKIVKKLAKKPIRRLMSWYFAFLNRKPPISEVLAVQLSQSAVGGFVNNAVSFRNIFSTHVFIACLRRDPDTRKQEILLLKQFGMVYQVFWKDSIFFTSSHPRIWVKDIDGDGFGEVICRLDSLGMKRGSKSLLVYSIRRGEAFKIAGQYIFDINDAPQYSINTDPVNDEDLSRGIEDLANSEKLIPPIEPTDLSDPKYAVERWHAENGKKDNGEVSLVFYKGRAQSVASKTVEIASEHVQWIAYFRGAVIGYMKAEDKFFVVYSPSWIYHSIDCLVFDGESLWMGSRLKPGLISFTLQGKKGFLHRYERCGWKKIPCVNSLDLTKGILIVNGRIKLQMQDLKREAIK